MSENQKLTLPAAALEAWEARYAKDYSARARSDQNEIQLIDALIAQVEAGQVWTDSAGEAAIGPMRWSDDAIAASVGGNAGGNKATDQRKALMIVGGLLLAFLVLSGIVLGPSLARAASKPTPTLEAAVIEITSLPPLVVDDSNVRLPLDVPRSLEIGGAPYQVLSGQVKPSGAMTYAELEGAQVAWFASPVNWLFGAPESVVLSLKPGDSITARTATGRVLTFVVSELLDVLPQENEYLAQRRVGLTLFPLPASAAPIRLVFARYDPSGEQPAVAPVSIGLGTPVPVTGGQFVVTGVEVNQQAGNVYEVRARGQSASALLVPALEIEGQIYPASEALTSGEFTTTFLVPALGAAQFVVDDQRVDLPLPRPMLSATLTGARFNGVTMEVDVALTASGGTAYLQPGDVSLHIPPAQGQPDPGEVAPVSVSPSPAFAVPGQATLVTLRFTWPPTARLAQLRLFDQLYQLIVQ